MQMQQSSSPLQVGAGGEMLSVNQRSMDAEIQKHMLDINPLQLAFNKVFSGWREVTVTEEIQLFGVTKKREINKIVIDRYSRIVNESGSNYLFNSCVPLITPAASSSHVKPIDIYNHWHGALLPVRYSLLDSYYLPSYICESHLEDELVGFEGKCTYMTSSAPLFREHQRNTGHAKYIKVVNPYELNIERYPEIVTKLANLAIITMKAKEGFTLKEFAEMYINTARSQQPIMQQPMVNASPLNKLMGR